MWLPRQWWSKKPRRAGPMGSVYAEQQYVQRVLSEPYVHRGFKLPKLCIRKPVAKDRDYANFVYRSGPLMS